MTAVDGALEWIKVRGYTWMVKCPECEGRIEGIEQENGIWCEASVLLSKTNPIGLTLWIATCETSARGGVCERSHKYQCANCHWTIIIE